MLPITDHVVSHKSLHSLILEVPVSVVLHLLDLVVAVTHLETVTVTVTHLATVTVTVIQLATVTVTVTFKDISG